MKLLLKIYENKYLKDTTITYCFALLASLINYYYQVFCNKLLKPEDFAALNSILSLFVVLVSFTSPISQWLIKVFSEMLFYKNIKQIKTLITNYYKLYFFVSLLLYFSSMFYDLELARVLKVNNYSYVQLLAIMINLSLFSLPVVSFFIALNKFFYSGFMLFVQSVLLIFSSYLFNMFKFDVYMAILAKLCGLVGSGLFGFYFFLNILKSLSFDKEINVKRKSLKYANIYSFYKVSIGTICIVVMINLDMVFANLIMDPGDAGVYATVSVFGKALYFIGTIFMPVFYSKCNEALQRQENLFRFFIKNFYYQLILLFICFVIFYVLIDLLVLYLNPSYSNLSLHIIDFAESIIIYPVIQLCVIFCVSINRYKVFYIIFIFMLIQSVFYLNSSTVSEYIEIRLYGGLVIFVLIFKYILYLFYNKSLFNNE